ncbi:hypothetical protein EVAR_99791_1 [Eumeta japonica]|uniref:Uncharacterized protein n=1 Tax=Eumeta variegata TaxID=151549 RepID=A0A4C1ZFH4_EUMVA|nr:hypothetical protein EVAR_99791_1 [Eumeta japonica]
MHTLFKRSIKYERRTEDSLLMNHRRRTLVRTRKRDRKIIYVERKGGIESAVSRTGVHPHCCRSTKPTMTRKKSRKTVQYTGGLMSKLSVVIVAWQRDRSPRRTSARWSRPAGRCPASVFVGRYADVLSTAAAYSSLILVDSTRAHVGMCFILRYNFPKRTPVGAAVGRLSVVSFLRRFSICDGTPKRPRHLKHKKCSK